MSYSYEIDPRPAELGGGWRLRLLADGEEMGGGVFPPEPGEPADVAAMAYADALQVAQDWIASRP